MSDGDKSEVQLFQMRMPREMHERLRTLAFERRVSMNELAVYAVSRFLDPETVRGRSATAHGPGKATGTLPAPKQDASPPARDGNVGPALARAHAEPEAVIAEVLADEERQPLPFKCPRAGCVFEARSKNAKCNTHGVKVVAA